MQMLRDLATAGLTASGGSCDFEDISPKGWAKEGRLSMRFFCFRLHGGGARRRRRGLPTFPVSGPTTATSR